ncbi:MAG: hypothetical protein OHK0039_17110 [Bacteroidia bacterium]
MNERITDDDRSSIKKYFGVDLSEITPETFKDLQKAARKKYHPDNFSHFGDDTVLDMAKERFQHIERLAVKIEAYLARPEPAQPTSEGVYYASEGMKIDIMTSDKTLKFQLFRNAIIYRGDTVSIPGTQARLVALDDYSPRIHSGFRDNIKVMLAFGAQDDLQRIVVWLFTHISGRSSSFVIEGKIVPIDPYAILQAMQRESVHLLEG